MDFAFIILGTVSIALSKSSKGIKRLIAFLGNGNSFKIAFVIIASVPSDPQIKSFKL